MANDMRLILISGRSGSGKSQALNTLEDCGIYKVDNLPVSLIPSLVESIQAKVLGEHNDLALSVDARNSNAELDKFPQVLDDLRAKGVQVTLAYLDSSTDVLVKRFSETRRKHPMSTSSSALQESLLEEEKRLDNISTLADLHIDTSGFSIHDLRDEIQNKLVHTKPEQLHITVQSFGFKFGTPRDSDFMFDVRCLPNPHWDPELRKHNGTEAEIQQFLGGKADVIEMLHDITGIVKKWLPSFKKQNRSYFTVSLGCTGGKHRSVYMAEQLQQSLAKDYANVTIRHRELDSWI